VDSSYDRGYYPITSDEPPSVPPFILQQSRTTIRDKFDHLTNILTSPINPDLVPVVKKPLKNRNLPVVFLSVTIEQKVLFLNEFLDKIESHNYPKDNLVLHVTVQSPKHVTLVNERLEDMKLKYR
jgi:hypothetical protein